MNHFLNCIHHMNWKQQYNWNDLWLRVFLLDSGLPQDLESSPFLMTESTVYSTWNDCYLELMVSRNPFQMTKLGLILYLITNIFISILNGFTKEHNHNYAYKKENGRKDKILEIPENRPPRPWSEFFHSFRVGIYSINVRIGHRFCRIKSCVTFFNLIIKWFYIKWKI